MSQNERFSLFVHIPSLKLVTNLSDLSKGWSKGHILVSNPWSGSSKRRHVEWVKKTLFARLNKLFKIDATEWVHNDLPFYEVACSTDSEAY
ncbi:hypothetical protein AAG906_019466 [Vitis piasezkii]